jgi:beta-glucosidase
MSKYVSTPYFNIHQLMAIQEHFRQQPEAQSYGYNISEAISSNIDDTTMHELYLWPFADAVRAGVGSSKLQYSFEITSLHRA